MLARDSDASVPYTHAAGLARRLVKAKGAKRHAQRSSLRTTGVKTNTASPPGADRAASPVLCILNTSVKMLRRGRR